MSSYDFNYDQKTRTYSYWDEPQIHKYGYVDCCFPPIDEIEEWNAFLRRPVEKPFRSSSLITMHAIIKSIGRKDEQAFLATQIDNGITEFIDSGPSALAKKATGARKQLIVRNKRAISDHMLAAIKADCLKAALDQENDDHKKIRAHFTVYMRFKCIRCFKNLMAKIDQRESAEKRLAALDIMDGILPEQTSEISARLQSLGAHVEKKQLEAFDHYRTGAAMRDDDNEQRSLRRNLKNALTTISEKTGRPLDRDDFDALIYLITPQDPSIVAMR